MLCCTQTYQFTPSAQSHWTLDCPGGIADIRAADMLDCDEAKIMKELRCIDVVLARLILVWERLEGKQPASWSHRQP